MSEKVDESSLFIFLLSLLLFFFTVCLWQACGQNTYRLLTMQTFFKYAVMRRSSVRYGSNTPRLSGSERKNTHFG